MTHGNGFPTTEGMAGTLGYEPESPFLSDIAISPRTAGASSAPGAFAPLNEVESPFVGEYAGEDGSTGPQAELFASVVGELYDPEFDESLEDLVEEAAAVAEEGPSFEHEDPAQQRIEMERTLQDYFHPLERATEGMLDRMAAGLGDKDTSQLSEAELEAVLDEFTPTESGLSPTFEDFLRRAFKKAKKAVKRAAKVAGKVAGAAAGVLPHRIVIKAILSRMKRLVRPLLQRVLRHAIDRLPVALRPLARRLGKQFSGASAAKRAEPVAAPFTGGGEPADDVGEPTGGSGEPSDTGGGEPEPAAADSADIQADLDSELAGYLIQGEDFERVVAAERSLVEQGAPVVCPIRELDRTRAEFARQITDLEDGEDPRPLVEHFLPAILGALKVGVRIIGRPRVVRFLARLVAKLITKYVGKQQAVPLSRALVDAGLRLVSLESAEEVDPMAAGNALAATVEDTISRLVQTVPEAAWESEALLEGYVGEAFQSAASAHFPDPLIRSELHEAAQASGAWIALPSGTSRKLYKKYTRIIEVTITPQTAAAVKTFRGNALRDFLKNRLGLSGDKPIRARVHLYEAISGTRLGLIALCEKKVPGLGTARREARSLIHPLTPEASGLLLNEPGLGKPVDPEFLARRGKIAVGQRFYYLQIPGARVRMAPRGPRLASRPARSGQTSVVLDFPKRQLRVFMYYSEADAQELAANLRRGLPLAAMLATMRGKVDQSLATILSGAGKGGVRVIHAAMPGEKVVDRALRSVGKELAGALLKWILETLTRELETRRDRFVGEFERAQKAEVDGVTVAVVFEVPAVLGGLQRAFTTGGVASAAGFLGGLRRGTTDYQLEIRPGLVSW